MNASRVALSITILFFLSTLALSQWNLDSAGVMIRDGHTPPASGADGGVILSDGAGGAYIIWNEHLAPPPNGWGDDMDVYAQRISPSGTVLWDARGVPVVTQPWSQVCVHAITDGSGGLIATWSDGRFWSSNNGTQAYAQRLSAGGATLWSTDGVALAPTTGDQDITGMISDDSGGAIITWMQSGLNGINWDIYAQRLNSLGERLWTEQGVSVISTSLDEELPTICPDGHGGAIIAWQQYDTSQWTTTAVRLFGQHLNAAGKLLWNPDGVVLCDAPTGYEYFFVSCLSDGAGGAFISWVDQRNSIPSPPGEAIYAQHIDGNGAALWDPNGKMIRTCGVEQLRTVVGNRHDMTLIWSESRPPASTSMLGQCIDSAGNELWAAAVQIADTFPPHDPWVSVSPAENGSVLIGWRSNRIINVQKLDSLGRKTWGESGLSLVGAQPTMGDPTPIQISMESSNPLVTTDQAGGAILSWTDNRHDIYKKDIYAQRINPYVPIAPPNPPSLSWRPNGWTNQPTNLTTRWHRKIGATTYDFELSVDSTFQLPSQSLQSPLTAVALSAIQDTFQGLSALSHGSTYYWRVRASNAAGTSPWSTAWSFTTTPEGVPEFPVQRYWNLVSLPLVTSDSSVTSLYPTARSDAYSYDPSTGYALTEYLQHAKGYWLRFDEDQYIPVTGSSFGSADITLKEGWNIVGALSSDISASGISVDPSAASLSSLWGYNGGYTRETTLQAGRAYWVKADGAATLHLSASTSLSGVPAVNHQAANETESTTQYSSLVLTDAEGHSQTLYYGSHASASLEYELPPAPPEGSFDIRYAGDRFLATPTLDNSAAKILLSSVRYPLTIRWKEVDPLTHATLLIDTRPLLLAGTGSIRMEDQPSELALGMSSQGDLPHEFSLMQNHPNPFNPSTMIEYAMPAGAPVTLRIYNLLGQVVATLVDEFQSAGYKSVEFDASNLPSGIYFCRLQAGSRLTETRKLVVLK